MEIQMKKFTKSGRKSVQNAEVVNYSGAAAYRMESEQELAQLAVTGCFNNTFYTKAEDQLDRVLKLSREVHPRFLAQVAVYARQTGFMKDMPAALVASLASRDSDLCAQVFSRVVDNGKMLRNFSQMIRSGSFGRSNLSAKRLRRLVNSWFNTRTDDQIFFQSVGDKPTLGDIVKMARVVPMTKERSALYAYLIGKKQGKFKGEEFTVADALPKLISDYITFVASPAGEIPRAPFEMLMGLPLRPEDWKVVATRATWTQTFKSLNTFARHGVFTDPEMVKLVVAKLTNKELIEKAKAFPYQILMAYKAITEGTSSPYSKARNAQEETPIVMPKEISAALEVAMELATVNVPAFEGLKVVICPDVSGSMKSAITGEREGSTTKVRCIDVAGLVASCLLRKNPLATVIPFEGNVVGVRLSPANTVIKNATILADVGGGSTECSAPIRKVNQDGTEVDVMIFISDYESHGQSARTTQENLSYWGSRTQRITTMAEEWTKLKKRNPNAKLICLDITPSNTTQVSSRGDTLNIGGFSDQVFSVMDSFVTGSAKGQWVDLINEIQV
jgi:60 kDa SS-A/Ro ribonucleoprotein